MLRFQNEEVKLLAFETLSSTQDYLRERLLTESVPFPIIACAKEQTHGIGRRGREWLSPRGGLWFSLAFRYLVEGERIPMVGLVCAAAAAHSVRSQTSLDCEIKWPNDVLSSGRKIAGILSDSFLSRNQTPLFLIGIGINTNNEFNEHLRLKLNATSIVEETGKEVDNETLLSVFVENFDLYLTMLRERPREVTENVRNLLKMLGKKIEVEMSDRVIRGTAIDISENGELIIETHGILKRVVSMSEILRIR